MKSRVLSAQPVVVIEMLYQVAIRELEGAVEDLKAGDHMNRATKVSRAQEAVNEMLLALNPAVQAPFVQSLAALYVYVQQQTLKGHAQQSEAAFQSALSVLRTLLEGWTGVRQELVPEEPAEDTAGGGEVEPEPVMETVPMRPAFYEQAVTTGSRDWDA